MIRSAASPATGCIDAPATSARRNVIISGMLGCFAFLLRLLNVPSLTTATICLSAAFFFVELIVGPIWSAPLDIAARYSGSASGMMNFGFGLAGMISPFTFGALVDWTGSWTLPFIGSIMLLPIGAGLAFFIRAEQPFLEPDTPLPAGVARST